jgi:hypothetical protein
MLPSGDQKVSGKYISQQNKKSGQIKPTFNINPGGNTA